MAKLVAFLFFAILYLAFAQNANAGCFDCFLAPKASDDLLEEIHPDKVEQYTPITHDMVMKSPSKLSKWFKSINSNTSSHGNAQTMVFKG